MVTVGERSISLLSLAIRVAIKERSTSGTLRLPFYIIEGFPLINSLLSLFPSPFSRRWLCETAEASFDVKLQNFSLFVALTKNDEGGGKVEG